MHTPLSFNSKLSCLEDMINDISYCSWIIKQNWFKTHSEYEVVKLMLSGSECKCRCINRIKGSQIGMITDSCSRTYCHADKSCCPEVSLYEYKCIDCGRLIEAK